MSFVTLIKDYVDVTNSSEQLNGDTFLSLGYYTLSFLFSVIKQVFVYFFTFQWLQNFSYFCLTPPQLLSSFANVTGIEHQPLSNLIAFSETESFVSLTGIGLLFLGFLNGCFSCIHISAANLVTVQRILVQGVPAGLCSAFGSAIGQCSFLACILFGFRGFLFPWLALEPLPFLLGTGILLMIASTTAQDRRTPTIQWSAKSSLLIFIFTNIALAWCEQTVIFQLMGNISFGIDPTLLETTPLFNNVDTVFGNAQKLIENISYLTAFFLGNFLGTFFLGYVLQRLLEFLLRYKGIPVYYGLVKQANLPLATLIFAFGFGSLPYYGFDYLIAKGFGFFPQEHFFQQTLFSPVNLVSKTSQTKELSQGRLEDQLALLFTLEGEKTKSFVIDTTPFDDGQYLKVGQKRPQAFEDLNYRGEHLWTNRLSRISNIREQANQTQSSFLGPVFSWMRSFLWGDQPATTNTEINASSNKRSRTTPRSLVDNFQTESPTKEDSNEFNLDTKTQHKFPTKETTEKLNETSYSTNSFFSSDNSNLTSPLRDPSEFNEIFTGNIKQKKELSIEKEQTDNYVKEFDRQFDKGFSNFNNVEPTSLIEVEDQWQEKRIKEKCYTNPIYKFLLNTEIDFFLSRQPANHWLSAGEEALLLKRRQLLSNYYDTLALTSQVSTSEALTQLIPKSYTNAIYNHQFKGTLKIARRLFSIKKEDKTRIVKFDQPLFSKEENNREKVFFHEELNFDADRSDIKDVQKSEREFDLKKHGNTLAKTENTQSNVFLLEQAEPLPLYASWDEKLRKLILTNRFQNQFLAGYTYSEFTKPNINSATNQKENESLSFTTWPLPNPVLPISTIANNNQIVDDQIDTSVPINKSLKNVPIHNTLNSFKRLINNIEGEDSNSLSKFAEQRNDQNIIIKKPTIFFKNVIDFIEKNVLYKNSKNQFLFHAFQKESFKEPVTNDMINALLQWQKLIKDNKPLSKEDKQAVKEKVSYWPKNVSRANWSNELVDNDIEFDEPSENILKKQTILWEFTPPNHGGFVWPGSIRIN